MSLRLFIDEDSQSKVLVKRLKAAGHDVLTVNDVSLSGAPDSDILKFSSQNNRIVLTRNCQDFEKLHHNIAQHAGIFAIYKNRETYKDMSSTAVVAAINNVEVANFEVNNQFIPLNPWSY